jgi:hypothetical protein
MWYLVFCYRQSDVTVNSDQLIVWLATKSDAGSNQWGVTERA